MADKLINIEVDGQVLSARQGQMLIEVTDANDIYIPRFCYHKKLSIAANCRMCLIEVDKVGKPLPACATPVVDGMKIATRSSMAIEAQKSVMEFLLINHPLDCPICDQGGECELQDLAMAYGSDVSRYQEKKRVVQDQNIGPLVQTDMTRCIHCTRCVRFGEEIAGLRELGGIGRGEGMQISSYIEKSMSSELSANVIDICPVGALTSKPFRFSARAWEMAEGKTIAAHDSVGSNVRVHVKDGQIKRVVPDEQAAINEVWISDRDRFSYLGLYSEDRLQQPMLKQQGSWHAVDWETALEFSAKRFNELISKHDAAQIGVLATPTATLEELYLLQKLCRGLGCFNIDHRLRQQDFSDQETYPAFPWLGQSIADIDELQAALLIGSNLRKEQPIINYRLKKAVERGAQAMFINPMDYSFNYPTAASLVASPDALPMALAGVLAALAAQGVDVPRELSAALADFQVTAAQHTMAQQLLSAERAVIWLGNLAMAHPALASIRQLAMLTAQLTGARFGYLGESANSAGAWLAGALPHRGPAFSPETTVGLDAWQMFAAPRRAYLLLGIEPELDSWDAHQALTALREAEFVLSCSAYMSKTMQEYADVILPIALAPESDGTLINCEGRAQTLTAQAIPPGESKPAWKILRVLADHLQVPDCAYYKCSDISAEFTDYLDTLAPDNMLTNAEIVAGLYKQTTDIVSVQRLTELPMQSIDMQVRRASALQETADIADGSAHINLQFAMRLGVLEAQQIRVCQENRTVVLPVKIDARVPMDCVLIHAGQDAHTQLGAWHGPLEITIV